MINGILRVFRAFHVSLHKSVVHPTCGAPYTGTQVNTKKRQFSHIVITCVNIRPMVRFANYACVRSHLRTSPVTGLPS